MDIKGKIEEIVGKLKSDPKLMAKFQQNPVGAIEDLTGLDLPDDQIKGVVEGVKAKLNLDDIGAKLGGLGNLFGRK